MAKQRFPRKMECWVSEQMANSFELLAQDPLLSMADHMRLAFHAYLLQHGAMKPRPTPNGQAAHG